MLAACGGSDERLPAADAGAPAADAARPVPGVALTIVTVDETGAPVPADRVVYQLAPADAFWLAPTPAPCVGGGAPPCSEWRVEGPITARLVVSAGRGTEATPSDGCIPFASSFAIVHPPTPEVPEQLLHLTLPRDGTYCVDPVTFRAVINHEHDETFDARDVLAPPAAVSGPITVKLVDQKGSPVPGQIAHWYYPPDGPDYDGEHPLACADQRCETWVNTDTPKAGQIYLNATYAGPLSPILQQGWLAYAAGPFEVEVDASGLVVPFTTTFELETDLEGAIGGDRGPRGTP